jgi:copper chaperone NosL
MNEEARNVILVCLFALMPMGCGSSEIKPIDIYPEDMCAHCRMAISDQHFASEIIAAEHDALKFDDIGCMQEFMEAHKELKISAVFLKDYTSRDWMPLNRATIVETDLATPMGSGKVAFADSSEAHEFAKQHPSSKRST